MTQPAILHKLSEHLARVPASESDVVYVFVQVRKLRELEGQKRVQDALKFYCDWIVHSELNGQGARQIVELIEARVREYVPILSGWIDPDGTIQNALSFERMRDALREFLLVKQLPTLVGR